MDLTDTYAYTGLPDFAEELNYGVDLSTI